MTGNSTLLYINDDSEGVAEFINVDEILDPNGKCSKELDIAFKSIVFSPSEELIAKILMNT
jgi:hypothetical protein